MVRTGLPRGGSDKNKGSVTAKMSTGPGKNTTNWGSKGMRLVRTWETLLILAESGKPLQSTEIHERLASRHPFNTVELSLQTTREDLKLMRSCGFPIIMVDESGCEICVDDYDDLRGRLKNVRWALRSPGVLHDADGRDGCPSRADILSLRLLRDLLHFFRVPGFWLQSQIDELLAEVMIFFNERLRIQDPRASEFLGRIQHVGKEYIGEPVSSEHLSMIEAAVQRNHLVYGVYTNRDEETHRVSIAPRAIFFERGRVYCLATCMEAKTLKAYRLDRFRSLKLDKTSRAPAIAQQDVQNYLREVFGGYRNDVERIVLIVDRRIAYLFREFRYHSTQELEELDGGSIRVVIECSTGWALEEWLLGFGELIRVQEPEALVVRLRERHLAAAKGLEEFLPDDAVRETGDEEEAPWR